MKIPFAISKACLLFFFFFISLRVTVAQPLNDKPLSLMSIDEVEHLFDVENQKFKEEKVLDLAEKMAKTYNGSMLIALGDRPIVKSNFGFTHLFKNVSDYDLYQEEYAITFSTFFELASVSKQFTAVAVLKLLEDGKLSLDDTLRGYFPELQYHNITIRHLLTHTSGLPDYIDFPEKLFPERDYYWENDSMIRIIAEQNEKILFSPGAKFEYTNTNYMLLASIVEKVSGIKFEDFVRENIFLPAGMLNSFYVTEGTRRDDNVLARGHLKNGDEIAPYFMDGTIGDKGLYSTVEELFLWKKAFFDKHLILSDETRLQAVSPQNRLNNGKFGKDLYGFGFRIEENPHYGKLIYHGGLWRGYQNLFLYREKDDLTIIFLTNCRNGAHYGKSNVILHILDGI